MAIDNYHDVFKQLPPTVVRSTDGKPLYSWRVHLLRFLEEDKLYKEFKLDEPWDSDHNIKLVAKMPRVYSKDYGFGADESGMTHYQVLVGRGTVFEKDGLKFSDVTDGLENTILVIEAADPVPWTKPVDLQYHSSKPLPRFGGLFTKPHYFLRREIRRTPGFNAAFVDATVRFIKADVDETRLRAVISRNGGENVTSTALED